MENVALEEQLRSANVHINVGNDNRLEELKFCVRIQRDKRRQLTEDQDKQRILVKSERKKARVKEKLIREIKEKRLLERGFTLYEILFVHKKADMEKIRRNCKKLATMPLPEIGGCEEHFKAIRLTCATLNNEKTSGICDQSGLEKAEDELLIKTSGVINRVFGTFSTKKVVVENHYLW